MDEARACRSSGESWFEAQALLPTMLLMALRGAGGRGGRVNPEGRTEVAAPLVLELSAAPNSKMAGHVVRCLVMGCSTSHDQHSLHTSALGQSLAGMEGCIGTQESKHELEMHCNGVD